MSVYRLYYLLTVRPPNTLVKLNASCKHLTSSFKDSSDIDGTQPHPLPVPWLLIRTGCHNRSLWHIAVVCWIEFIHTDQWLQIIKAKRQQCFLLQKLFRCHFQGCSFFQSKAHSVEGNPLKLEDEFRHPRHTAMLAAAKASLVPSPRAELKIEATPREEKLPVTHRQGLA